jgi:hypothetical protein
MSNESNDDKNMPDVVPAVDEVVSLNETDDEDAIDLMDGVGLKKPEHIEPDVVFKGDAKPKVSDSKKVKVVVDEEKEDTPNLAVMPDDVKEDLMEQGIKPMDKSDIKKVKYNKNGKPRKPMTKDRLEKLAIARQKALETRQRNKRLKEEAQKKLKIKQIVDDEDVEVQITKKIINNEESVPATPKPTPSVKKLSREEKDKKIQDAVAEGVKKALEVERLERKRRKEEKKKKAEEEKQKTEKLNKDKMISNQINKLNDIDNFYDKCFNFT